MERYDKNLADIMSIDAWKEMANDPAIYKVAANFTVFPLASVLDFKKVEDFAVKHKLKTPHRMLQTGLLLSGAYMILRFGELGKIFSARAFGRMNVAAGFVRLGQLSETGAGAPKPDVVARLKLTLARVTLRFARTRALFSLHPNQPLHIACPARPDPETCRGGGGF